MTIRPSSFPNLGITHRRRALQSNAQERKRWTPVARVRGQSDEMAHAVGDLFLDVADHDQRLVLGQAAVPDFLLRWWLVVVSDGDVDFGVSARCRHALGVAQLAGFEEMEALVAEEGRHTGEGFVEDDDVGFVDDGAEEEDDALLGGVEVAEGDVIGPLDVIVWGNEAVLVGVFRFFDLFTFAERWREQVAVLMVADAGFF